MSEIIDRAKEKLSDEIKRFQGDQKEKAVSSYVVKTLIKFCEVEAFAAAVINNKKTLSDCCKAIMGGTGNYVSDLDVYRKAAQFYFPGAKIDFTMSIAVGNINTDIVAEVEEPKEEPIKQDKPLVKKSSKAAEPPEDTIQISLFGL